MFTPIDPADCDPGKFGKSSLFNLIRTDLDDLDSRLSASQPSALGDHFNWKGYNAAGLGSVEASFEGIEIGTGGATALLGRDWRFAADGVGVDAVNADKPDFSVARMSITSTSTPITFGFLMSRLSLMESEITDPITVTMRLKLSDDLGVQFGLTSTTNGTDPFTAGPIVARRGIFIERVDASNWRFKNVDGPHTHNGASFARPSFGDWFEVQIIFSADHADCLVDGLIKETFTVDLPTNEILHATIGTYFNASVGGDLDIDRCDFYSAGLIDAP